MSQPQPPYQQYQQQQQHQYQETGWGNRMGKSLKGLVGGILIGMVGIGVLIWNEGNFVRQTKGLEEGLQAVTEVYNVTMIDPTKDGKLIHVIGRTYTHSNNVSDPLFGITFNHVIRLKRNTEMYQWVEYTETNEEKHAGGSKTDETTYTYSIEWRSDVINSNQFYDSQHHTNPNTMLYESNQWIASNVTFGGTAYTLSSSMIEQKMNWFIPLNDNNDQLSIDHILYDNL